jgi:hypothetical protein
MTDTVRAELIELCDDELDAVAAAGTYYSSYNKYPTYNTYQKTYNSYCYKPTYSSAA